jgi:hypothetical protein
MQIVWKSCAIKCQTLAFVIVLLVHLSTTLASMQQKDDAYIPSLTAKQLKWLLSRSRDNDAKPYDYAIGPWSNEAPPPYPDDKGDSVKGELLHRLTATRSKKALSLFAHWRPAQYSALPNTNKYSSTVNQDFIGPLTVRDQQRPFGQPLRWG